MNYEIAVLIEYRRQRARGARHGTPRRGRHSSVRRYVERWCRPRPANAATRARAGRRPARRAIAADAASASSSYTCMKVVHTSSVTALEHLLSLGDKTFSN